MDSIECISTPPAALMAKKILCWLKMQQTILHTAKTQTFSRPHHVNSHGRVRGHGTMLRESLDLRTGACARYHLTNSTRPSPLNLDEQQLSINRSLAFTGSAISARCHPIRLWPSECRSWSWLSTVAFVGVAALHSADATTSGEGTELDHAVSRSACSLPHLKVGCIYPYPELVWGWKLKVRRQRLVEVAQLHRIILTQRSNALPHLKVGRDTGYLTCVASEVADAATGVEVPQHKSKVR